MMVPSDDRETYLDGETLFRRYAPFVASFLYRLGVPASDVNDLVQEVFLSAHKRGGYRPGTTSPKTYLARISLEAKLANERHNARWRASHVDGVAAAIVGQSPENPEGTLAVARAARKLQNALDSIEPGARTVFILFELHGESCETIAAGLDLKLGTVYSRLHFARKKFLTATRGPAIRESSSITIDAEQEAV